MSNELNGQDLIEAFWEAERLRCLDRCQEILKSLEILSSQQPTLEPWCKYLRGYLAFGMHRWAQAERILTDLLRTELKAALRGYASYALGRTFDVQGRWQEAITAFEQTLSIFTKLGQTVEQARAWKHMAITFHKGFTQGDFGSAVLQQAVAHCQSALDVLELMRDPPPEIIYLKGSIWNTLGLIHVSLDQLAEAIACYQQDLVICRALDDRHGMGLTYGNLGEVYQKRKNWPEALQSYQQALRIIREFDDRYEETEALANIAFLYQEMGDYDLALDSYSQAIQIIETLRAGISSEAARAGFFATIINTYANTMLLCLEAGRETQAFDYVERARSRTFLDILTARSPDLSRKMESSTMTLAEVQATLADDTLLLEYFTTGLLEARDKPAANSKRHRFPPAKTLILAVTRSQLQVVEVDLSPNDLRPRSLEDVVEQHFLQPQIRRTLYNKLIAPVEHLLPGKRRLYLAPHGPLHYIPFQALLSPDGDTLLREAGPQLIYAPSATLLCQQRPGPAQAPKSCLSVGYNSQGET
ncbi:MAG: tetratricopeptide repeat protein, partial [Gammaproteobacteria bacterium]|nr:tetratricopeptide repeat protein [Gammaproteobacteria bacterium]